MLILLSPAKSLNFETPPHVRVATHPRFLPQSQGLIDVLRGASLQQIASLMSLSDKLAALNLARYAEWTAAHELPRAKQAVLAFDGDVYDGLGATSAPAPALEAYLQAHLGILSGLYGLLRPLDLIHPYRLEMGTRLRTSRAKDLYDYWGDLIAGAIEQTLDEREAEGEAREVVNLASEEYAKAARLKTLRARIVTPVFQEFRNGAYKIVSFSAKRARGAMTRFALDHAITSADPLKAFDRDGYAFDAAASDRDTWYFRRMAA
ncbi:peroxide stress protein YaaA [Niveibacterium sp. 24ML]|uniref:peroxide stress protein YaaA n=1 Tax=Niveibacterium sp. 24ML TaxID=2985512 RepID=UPI00226F3C83|nr:peroxide stress protein YaaA [Niveibacterium sp. 24ML]MCX9155116.1 peroxide stress protein YaaA [Niveibacterium sp. 24ML]